MFVCWRDRVAYDDTTYLNSLKRRGSPRASKPDSLGKNGAHPNAPPRRRPRKRRAKAGR